MKKKIASILLTSALVISSFSGCGGSNNSSSASSASSETGSAASSNATETKTLTEMNVAVGTQIATLDPALSTTTHIAHIIYNTNMMLFRTMADGSYEKELCKEYTISEDGLTYTFDILEGIKWSDGKEVTAEDVVFTLKRAIGYGPDNAYNTQNLAKFVKGAANARDNMLNVADMSDVGIYTTGTHSFTIELETNCPYFLRLLGGTVSSIVRSDFAVEHESSWSLKPGYPALGAFMLSSVNENESAVYVKNPNYYKADEVALEKIEYLVMPDQSAQLQAFKAGAVDLALSVPSAISGNSEYKDSMYQLDTYMTSYFVALNSGSKGPEALKNVNVRKALALAVNKETVLKMLNGGDNIIALNGYIPFGFEGIKGDFRGEKNDYLSYNKEKAIELLAEAGYNAQNPLKLEYMYSNSQFHSDIAQILQQLWSQIGVTVELKAVEMGVFYDFVDNGEFQMSRYGLNNSNDPLDYLNNWVTSSQIVPAIEDTKYDQMIADAFKIVDPTEYKQALHDIETYLLEEQAYLIPLLSDKPVRLLNPEITGLWGSPTGTMHLSGAKYK